MTGDCGAGHYCPGGVTEEEPSEYTCEVGYYCPTGSVEQILCADGTYTSATGQSSCTSCPAGKVCSDNNAEEDCPLGYYCETGDKKVPCPLGYYGEAAGTDNVADGCQPCPAGYACNEQGLSAATTKCDGGYYCTGTATTQRPNGAAEGGYVCQPGYFCP